jgi:aminocarboxymuconate-semialdehyde decarboxylase
MYTGRMDHAWEQREDCRRHNSQRPSETLRRLYFDTVVHSAEQLAFLASRYGSSQLMLGSDYPFDMAEPAPLALIEAAEGLSAPDREAIAGGNAMRVLRLPARRAPAAPRAT